MNYLTVEQNLKLLESHYLHTKDFPIQLFNRLSEIIKRIKVQPIIEFENNELYWEYEVIKYKIIKYENKTIKLRFTFKKELIDKYLMEVRIDNELQSIVTITTENFNNFYMDVLLDVL